MRSAGRKERGGESSPGHLLSASASTLEGPEIWWTSSSIPYKIPIKHNFSRNKHWGNFVVKSQLQPDSAPVLSEKDGSVIGKRCPGFNLEAIHKMAICANVSKAEMDFCRSSCNGISKDRKSCRVYCSENQRMVDSSSLMNPPMPQEWPCAYASAAARPVHKGLDLKRTYGDTWFSQVNKIFKIRVDDTLRIRLSEVGSLTRIQTLLSEILTVDRSSKELNSWWRAETRRPPTGILVPGGCEVKMNWSERCSDNLGHDPGSML